MHSRELFRAILDHLPIGIWFTDTEGTILYGNPAAQRIWAGARYVGPAEFHEYEGWWEETGEPIAPDEWAAARAIRSGETSLNELVRIQCFDGSTKVILNSSAPLRGPGGEIEGAVILNEDITDRRRTERERDLLEARVAERTAELRASNAELRRQAALLAQVASQLTHAEQRERRRLARVLHDHVQQLLVATKVGLAVLQRRTPAAQEREFERLRGLVVEAIEASRSLAVELSPPILHQAGLTAALEWLAGWMEDKHGLIVEVEAVAEVQVPREDIRILLFEATRELLLNVVKHAGVHAAWVRIAPAHDARVRVEVRDEGEGFVLDGESSAGGSSAGGDEHLGFGLFTVRERLRLLGGDIRLESSPGEGTRVVLEVPAGEQAQSSISPGEPASRRPTPPGVEKPPSPAQSESGQAGELGARVLRVLLVEDHALVRQGFVSLLNAEPDLEVVGEAEDGLEAVELVRAVCPDVVLMDYSLPGIDGPAATRRILAESSRVRVIGLSMFDDAARKRTMIAAGATAYLSKSGRAEALLEVVRSVAAEADEAGAA